MSTQASYQDIIFIDKVDKTQSNLSLVKKPQIPSHFHLWKARNLTKSRKTRVETSAHFRAFFAHSQTLTDEFAQATIHLIFAYKIEFYRSPFNCFIVKMAHQESF